jgi:hypothetical protein
MFEINKWQFKDFKIRTRVEPIPTLANFSSIARPGFDRKRLELIRNKLELVEIGIGYGWEVTATQIITLLVTR